MLAFRWCWLGLVFLFSSIPAQETKKLPLRNFKIAVLSDSLQENSGLGFFGEKLFTLNDGGNPSELYQINAENGKIIQTISIPVPNIDWEALAFSGNNMYIGDFGNNRGTRKDLKIYKIPVSSIKIITDSISTVSFYYPEQKDFTPKNLNNNYDLEAMIFHENQLHLFSKAWENKTIVHYTINPNETNLQPAIYNEEFATNFVVTDAAYHAKKLYLLGYNKKTEAFLMICNETSSGIFFNEKPQKYYLGSTLFLSQLEGIAVNDTGIYISGEAFHSPLGTKKQTIYHIPFSEFVLNN
ncbi:MAG: hypothetical protein JST62_03320 [Bacteroidetes bacterium]|nr:hypothetical protein [Bacteroidota bacterium]